MLLAMIEAENLKVINTLIECNDNVTGLCDVLLADHHVISGMNSDIIIDFRPLRST